MGAGCRTPADLFRRRKDGLKFKYEADGDLRAHLEGMEVLRFDHVELRAICQTVTRQREVHAPADFVGKCTLRPSGCLGNIVRPPDQCMYPKLLAAHNVANPGSTARE